MILNSNQLSKRYRRKKNREMDSISLFGQKANTGLLFAARLFVVLFLTPVIIITSFASQEAILIAASIVLALAYLVSFLYRIYQGKVSMTEGIVTFAGLGVSIYLSMLLILPLLPVATTSLAVMSCMGIVATSVNTFFLLKTIIFPPIKKISEYFMSFFYKYILKKDYIPHPLFSVEPLTVEKDDLLIAALTNKTENLDKASQPYNELIEVLARYVNKYKGLFLGEIRRQDEIDKVTKVIFDLTQRADHTAAKTFLKIKQKWKCAKRDLLTSDKQKLTQYHEAKETANYSAFSKKLFFKPPNTHDKALNLLEQAIQKQEKKMEKISNILKRLG